MKRCLFKKQEYVLLTDSNCELMKTIHCWLAMQLYPLLALYTLRGIFLMLEQAVVMRLSMNRDEIIEYIQIN